MPKKDTYCRPPIANRGIFSIMMIGSIRNKRYQIAGSTDPTELATDSEYQRLLGRISAVYTTGQVRAHQAVARHLAPGGPHDRSPAIRTESAADCL